MFPLGKAKRENAGNIEIKDKHSQVLDAILALAPYFCSLWLECFVYRIRQK